MIKLFKFLKPHTIPIAAVLTLIFIQSLSELYLPTLMSDIVDIGIVSGNTDYIIKTGLFMLLVGTVGALALIGASYLSAKIASGFGKTLRSTVFSHVESFSLYEFNEIGTASLITRTTNDITQIQQVTIMMLRIVSRAPMMMIGGIIMAVSKDATLSLLIAAALPIVAVAIFFITSKGLPLFSEMQLKLDKLNRVVREGLNGIRVVRAFNNINYEKRRFNEANSDLISTAIRVNRIMAALMPIMMLILNYTIIAIIWFGSIRIDNGNMQVGDLMAFIQYVMQIMSSMIMLSMVFVMIPRASASAVRINEVLETLPRIKDAQQLKSADSIRGSIEFKNVTFSYPGAEHPAIMDISFKTRPGKTTAIVGGTGSGKSTLINLIPRFYDIDKGSIMVDGVDVHEISQKNLRAKIGLVPQDTLLFTGTIADNIRYGREDASDEEIQQAAQTAQAVGFISSMGDNFDSFVTQGGTNISGGQKQRISIARALVRKPEIYIFDDSFSALDFKTDARLRSALKKETANSTMLIVAQRVSTVMDADQIIVLDNGRIMGIGSHHELLDSCEVYREIVSSQFAKEETACT